MNNNSKPLKIFHQNIQNLQSRIEQLEVILSEIDPDIIILTEHNMNNIEMERFNLQNYSQVAQYTRSTTTGGGVVILSKESLRGRHMGSLKVSNLCQDKLFECCYARFRSGGLCFVLVGIYRTPQFENSEFLNRLNCLIESLITKEKYLIIVGDFNINILKNSPELKEFKNILLRNGLINLIDFPTRVTATTKTCIDNILTNISKDQLQVEGIITALSDHDGQVMELLKFPGKTNNSNLKYWSRNFSLNNINLFKSLLEKENWLTVFNSSIKEKYRSFHNIFQYYFDLSFPRVQKKKINKCSNNWITEELKAEKQDLINLNKLSKNCRSQEVKDKFKNKNKVYKLKLINAKRHYYEKKLKALKM